MRAAASRCWTDPGWNNARASVMPWSRRNMTGCCQRSWRRSSRRANFLAALCAGPPSRGVSGRRLARAGRAGHCAPVSSPVTRHRQRWQYRGVQVAVVENHLIEMLPRKDRLSLLAICEPVQLVLSEVLYEPGKPTRHVYFPIDGFISLVAQLEGHPGLEVGMVGREGMLGAQLALGVVIAPLHALVQGAGAAWR